MAADYRAKPAPAVDLDQVWRQAILAPVLSLKLVHMGAAALSVGLFALRGFLSFRAQRGIAWFDAIPRSARDDTPRWTRVVPHVIDTLFLATGIWLAVRLGQYPFVQPWLTAKVLALVAYIILGSIALKRGPTKAIRAAAFVAALAVFAYIVGVARTRHPWSWGLWLG
jgi:uncharacterized membrane protein SirB2